MVNKQSIHEKLISEGWERIEPNDYREKDGISYTRNDNYDKNVFYMININFQSMTVMYSKSFKDYPYKDYALPMGLELLRFLMECLEEGLYDK